MEGGRIEKRRKKEGMEGGRIERKEEEGRKVGRLSLSTYPSLHHSL